MKLLEKATILLLFISIPLINVPLWGIDAYLIQEKYAPHLQSELINSYNVAESTKELPKDSRYTYHIGSQHHIPGNDTNSDDFLFEWIDLEDNKDSLADKKTLKINKCSFKKTISVYPNNITIHHPPFFLIDSTFLL
jgi:hypothetical protein